MQGSVAVGLKKVCLAACAALLLALALGSAERAMANDKGFVVTLASQKMGKINPQVAYEPGTNRVYIATDRQIFRLSADRQHFEHIAGSVDLNQPLDLGVHPREATLSPNSIAVHPVTKQLYIADSRSHRILRISLDGQRFEPIAGTGETDLLILPRGEAATATLDPSSLAFDPGGKHDLYFINAGRRIFKLMELGVWGWRYEVVAGSTAPHDDDVEIAGLPWLDTNMHPAFLTFNPRTRELFYQEREVSNAAGFEGRNQIARLSGDGTIQPIAGVFNQSRSQPIKFEPNGKAIYVWPDNDGDELEDADRVLTLSRINPYSPLGKGWTTYDHSQTEVGELQESSLFDPATKSLYFTRYNHGQTSIHRVSRDSRHLDEITPEKLSHRASAFAETWSSGDSKLELLEIDPTTGNLIFLQSDQGRNNGKSVHVREFIQPDEFGKELRRKIKAGNAALKGGQEAEFERVFASVKSLARKPEQQLHCVNRDGLADKLTLPPGCQLTQETQELLGGGYHLPQGPTSLITQAMSDDPQQRSRELRAKAAVEMLSRAAGRRAGKELCDLGKSDPLEYFAEIRRISSGLETNGQFGRAHFFRGVLAWYGSPVESLIPGDRIIDQLRNLTLTLTLALGWSEEASSAGARVIFNHSAQLGDLELIASSIGQDDLFHQLATHLVEEARNRSLGRLFPILYLHLEEYLFAKSRMEEAGFVGIRTPESIRAQAEKARQKGDRPAGQQAAWLEKIATAVERLEPLPPIHTCSLEQLKAYVDSYQHIWNDTPRTADDPDEEPKVKLGSKRGSAKESKVAGKRERVEAADDNPAAEQRHRAEDDVEPGEPMDLSDGEEAR